MQRMTLMTCTATMASCFIAACTLTPCVEMCTSNPVTEPDIQSPPAGSSTPVTQLPSAPRDAGQMIATWSGASEVVRVDINWYLPDARLDTVTRGDWGISGATSGTLTLDRIPDGVHRFALQLNGDGRSAMVQYRVSLLDYEYTFAGRLQGPFERQIVVEVNARQARVLFNGWLSAGDAASGEPAGFQTAEVQAAWRKASDAVRADVSFVTPDASLPVSNDDWGLQGFERAAYPKGVALKDGNYRLGYTLNGDGRDADVIFQARFPGYQTRVNQRLIGEAYRVIGLDATGGLARVVFDGWKQAGEKDSGGVTGVHPLEVVAGWRNAPLDVRVDIQVYYGHTQLPVWTHDWNRQGYARTYVPSGVALADGTYRFAFRLNGSGRTADIAYDARFMNWSYSTARTIIGDAEQTIDLMLSGGVVTEIANGWRN